MGTFNRYHEDFGVPKEWPLRCDMVDKYANVVMHLLRAEGPEIEDCHFLPQWRYASKVDHVFHQSRNLQSQLRALHPNFANLTLHAANSAEDGPCKRFNITKHCLSEATVAAFEDDYREDYEHLGFVRSSNKK